MLISVQPTFANIPPSYKFHVWLNKNVTGSVKRGLIAFLNFQLQLV